jgi:hypothetical protein
MHFNLKQINIKNKRKKKKQKRNKKKNMYVSECVIFSFVFPLFTMTKKNMIFNNNKRERQKKRE